MLTFCQGNVRYCHYEKAKGRRGNLNSFVNRLPRPDKSGAVLPARRDREDGVAISPHSLHLPDVLTPTSPKGAFRRSLELANIEKALHLVANDPRLGDHQEAHIQMCDSKSIRAKITQLKKVILEGIVVPTFK